MSTLTNSNSANGRPAVTLADIAKRCSLSKGSVSRALSMTADDCPLSLATWTRVREVAAEMGYRVNVQARALASGRSMSIGLLYEGTLPLLDSVYHQIIETFSATLREHAYQLALVALDETDQWEDALLGGRVDGCVCLHNLPPRLEKLLPRMQRPLVLLNGTSALASGSISVDDRGGAELVTRHLLGLGHQRLLMLTDTQHETPHHSIAERQAGFLQTVRGAGDAEALFFEGDGDAFAAAWSGFDAVPTAVVCYSHVEAVGALRVLHRAGVDVPGDVSLATFNDVFPVAQLDPALTCVAVPSAEIGRRAADMLLGLLNGDPGPEVATRKMVLAPTLITRESTAAAAPA